MSKNKFNHAVGKVVSVDEMIESYMNLRSVRLTVADERHIEAHDLLNREIQARARFLQSVETNVSLQADLRANNNGELGLWKDRQGGLYASAHTHHAMRHAVEDQLRAGGVSTTVTYAHRMLQLQARAFVKCPSYRALVGKELKPLRVGPEAESPLKRAWHRASGWVSDHLHRHRPVLPHAPA